MPTKLSPTELNALFKHVETNIHPKINPGVTLNVVQGAAECVVLTDGNMLMQIMMALLNNAAKFTTRGAITFGYELYDDEVAIFVKDSGAGLAPDIKGRISDLFEADDTTSPGLGQGLPMAYMLAKNLEGTLAVESRGPNRGSQFTLYLPYSEEQAAASQPQQEQGAVSQPEEDFCSSGRIRILVAEDNDSNYLLVHTVLKHNYDVIRASDGVEAIEMYRKYRPDLILMDIQMPNMDGYEATAEIRKFAPDVPIIAATAYAFVTDRKRLLDSGFNGYVSKPINFNRLEREINACLGDKTSHV